ncbi:endo-1,4-beta-xylanase [Segatella copri]|uniref:endo-1,4-beta-xylanase n=1 Tax=Segatella copri TaxID=165179 RepID=UPI001F325D69|nr:endo-1,4-beta-xylanase [Segatella copri]
MKLKNINLGLGLVALLALSSCADDKFSEYRTDMTKNLKDYQYLNNYEPLKKYVEDMKAAGKCNPDFKLGIALEAAEFNKQELVYCLAGSNFNEMTAGNAMKMSSCVKDDGSTDFSLVKEFVKNAQDADMTIYGHTLAWHSQAANKYLKNLIKDKELPPDPNGGNKYLEIACGEAGANKWDKQISYELPKALVKGQSYVMTVKVKASDGGTFAAWPIWEASDNKNQWGGSNDVQYMEDYDITNDYSTLKWEFTANFPIDKLQFVFGNVGGTISCDDFKLTKAGSDENLIENGDFAKESARGWNPTGCTIKVASAAASKEVEQLVHEKTYTDGPFPFFAMGCEPPVVNGAIHFVPTGDWSQFFVMPGGENTLSEEGNYVVYLDLSASKDASGVELTMQNGWGGSDQQITVSVPVSAGRHTVKLQMPNIAGGNYDIILKPQTADATLDVHSVKVCQVKNLNSIPLTDEEKKKALTTAMGTWIDGMMESTDGYVTTWEVVNEAISGKVGADGFNELQHATNAPASDVANSFYWQDYLGDIDYVRTAVRDARKSFAEHNGDPSKLKLFINDYNLEGYWDQHAKLKSLIHWIGLWEDPNAEEPVVIDGIGTQMHVTCYGDATKQAKLQSDIEEMFKLMAKTGKLVKISELDMAYEDEAGTSVTFDKMTEEQHKQMRSFYTFIIQKYFELIPQAQQYGITQWCATDSPKDSGWRPGCPTGLWDSNYLRKHTYAGFAAGLGAPEYWKDAK